MHWYRNSGYIVRDSAMWGVASALGSIGIFVSLISRINFEPMLSPNWSTNNGSYLDFSELFAARWQQIVPTVLIFTVALIGLVFVTSGSRIGTRGSGIVVTLSSLAASAFICTSGFQNEFQFGQFFRSADGFADPILMLGFTLSIAFFVAVVVSVFLIVAFAVFRAALPSVSRKDTSQTADQELR